MEQAIIEIYWHIGDRYPVSAGVKQILERNLGKGYASQIPPA
jgi:hypothetical protein